MTDRPRSSADDPPEVTQVRRLLADARYTGRMPDDVAARMDDVLARLGGDPASGAVEPLTAPSDSEDAKVVDLAARRRRRAVALLGAAAVVVVGGVAFAQNLPSPGPSGGSTTSAVERAQAEGGANLDQGSPQGSPGVGGSPTASSSDRLPTVLHRGRVVVRPGHFTDDALAGRRLLALNLVHPQGADQSCAGSTSRGARVVPAEYRRARAVLVYRRPESAAQVVDLVVCGTRQPIRSATLPAS